MKCTWSNKFPKNTSIVSKHQLNPTLFFWNENFQKNYKCWIKCISKKFTTTGSANTCIFFAFLKKITTTGSSHLLSPNGQGCCVISFSFIVMMLHMKISYIFNIHIHMQSPISNIWIQALKRKDQKVSMKVEPVVRSWKTLYHNINKYAMIKQNILILIINEL